jgi:hypothetical protein
MAPDPCQPFAPLAQAEVHQGYPSARPDEVEEASSADSSEYIEDAPILQPGHPFLGMKDKARDRVFQGFRTWQGQIVSRPGFRPPARISFACPFAVHDPMKWKNCFCDTLVEVRDVRRHLIRRHAIPFYCPRCIETFDDEQNRDTHIRAGRCRSRPWAGLDGITESKKRDLEKRGPTNLSSRQQWIRIFDIVFEPRAQHMALPESPYLDSELHHDIAMFREFLAQHGPAILSEVLTFRGHATWNLPNEERDLAAFQRMVLDEGIRELVDQWYSHPPGDCREDESSFDSVNSVDQQRTPSAGSHAISDGRGGRWDRGGLGARRGSASGSQARSGPRIHDDNEWPMDGFARDGHRNADFDVPLSMHKDRGGDGGGLGYLGQGRPFRRFTAATY